MIFEIFGILENKFDPPTRLVPDPTRPDLPTHPTRRVAAKPSK
jgi:hypothetical protein